MSARTPVNIDIDSEAYTLYRQYFGKGQITRDVNAMVKRKVQNYEKKEAEQKASKKKRSPQT